MASLEDVANRAQNALNDAGAATWSQSIIEEWVREAIRDYNSYFRRTTTENVTMPSTTNTVDVSPLAREVLAVEYPKDQDSPIYLNRMNRFHPDFYKNSTNFDFEPVNEWGQTEDGGYDPYLTFSTDLASGQQLRVTERAIHDSDLASADLVTIPDEHQHLLILFVLWKAHSERTITEAQDPDTTIRMINQMKQAAQMAEQDYRRAISQALKNTAQGGWTLPWKSDTHDRIY
jgi:hypothetical protein